MKISQLIIALLMTASALSGSCAHDCQLCKTTSTGNACGVCFKKLLQDGTCQGDGPANCDVPLAEDYCYRCSPGFLLDTASGQCKANTIPKCSSGTIDDGTTTCDFCIQSSPSADKTACSGASQISNCLWEGTIRGDPNCARCVSGYSSQYNKCVIQVFRGCLELDESGLCVGCDVFDGWFMTTPGICAQGSADRNKRLFFSRR